MVALVFSVIATASYDGIARVCSAADGSVLATASGHHGPVKSVAISRCECV